MTTLVTLPEKWAAEVAAEVTAEEENGKKEYNIIVVQISGSYIIQDPSKEEQTINYLNPLNVLNPNNKSPDYTIKMVISSNNSSLDEKSMILDLNSTIAEYLAYRSHTLFAFWDGVQGNANNDINRTNDVTYGAVRYKIKGKPNQTSFYHAPLASLPEGAVVHIDLGGETTENPDTFPVHLWTQNEPYPKCKQNRQNWPYLKLEQDQQNNWCLVWEQDPNQTDVRGTRCQNPCEICFNIRYNTYVVKKDDNNDNKNTYVVNILHFQKKYEKIRKLI